MALQTFEIEARLIVSRNTTPSLVAASARFDPREGRLSLIYFVDHAPDDDDEACLELSCGELVAAFPKIRHVETSLQQVSPGEQPGVIEGPLCYLRDS